MGLQGAHAVLSWFAGDHAAVASWLAHRRGMPSILVAGGADVANMPEIGYGAMAGTFKQRLSTRWSLRLADLILPFSESVSREILAIRRPRRMVVLPLGVDTDRFTPATTKGAVVATVGNVSQSNLVRKGHRTFVEAARRVPEARFVLAGRPTDEAMGVLQSTAPPNVELPGYLSEDNLLALYRLAKVYVQVSAHEGFGLSLAEAMACDCVPVVTRRGSIPEVVGETGQYVPWDDAESLAKAIQTALAKPDTAGRAARERIVERYSLGRRQERLRSLIGELMRRSVG
ncbi:MAG TPA: glycosyltransferase [Thermoplasmata archaeon]